jgi:hypothetical protein
MADRIEPEEIPDPDLLLCRVHWTQFNFEENRITSTVFKQQNQSVDWSKYSTPEQTVARHKAPSLIWGIAMITAGACRSLNQEVVHVPLAEGDADGPNLAHAEIRGNKTTLIKSQLRDAITSKWENPLFRGPN